MNNNPDSSSAFLSTPSVDAEGSGSNNSTLELRHIYKNFIVKKGALGQRGALRAVNDVSLTLQRGETLGLVGESGSGKSTLGKIAAGLLPPSSGEVLLYGKKVDKPGEQPIQMIFQDSSSALNPRHSIGWSVRE
ncbi:MAG: ATP-binding cassette domain-containing protein, partial [Desulfovibrionaceae bacterium]|nr:ATP-binding cassette domain-containing protein [Desulfovibrionaceae bacterium]